VIPSREILDLRAEWSLDPGIIEKDYVLGWLLAGIATQPLLAHRGCSRVARASGSATTRRIASRRTSISTIVNSGPEAPEDLVPIFQSIRDWLQEESGVSLVVDGTSFRRRRNSRGKPTTQGRVAYRGPSAPRQLPKVKIDITSDEVLVLPGGFRSIGHQYSDALPRGREPSATHSPRCSPRNFGRSRNDAGLATCMT